MPRVDCDKVFSAADIDRRTIGVNDGEALLGRLARHNESSQDKGRAGHTVAKGFTLSYVVTAESADAYRDFTPIPCGSLSHTGVLDTHQCWLGSLSRALEP
ncbi:hypothetical protein KU43P_07630 [Pseudomonas sp. KU43P]|nr:hypothetical protein KU43P_07630 [Pseudomonas sp. KU43P]